MVAEPDEQVAAFRAPSHRYRQPFAFAIVGTHGETMKGSR